MRITLLAFAATLFMAIFSCKKTIEVEIQPAPRPEFSANIRSIQPGDSVIFANDSKGNIETWSWSFEGAVNSFSNEKTPPPVRYTKPGRYQVSLTVGGPNGANTITKTDYITVNSIAFTVEWLKTDSLSDSYLFYRGRIKGFSPSAVYRAIAFIYDYDDPNPGTTSYGFYVYPNSKGEFLAEKQSGSENFYYRILAYSLDYDVYLSEVRQTQFPKVTFSVSSITSNGQYVQVAGQVSNLSNNGMLRLLTANYPATPVYSSMSGNSYTLDYNNGIINSSALVSATLIKQNVRLYGRDFTTGAVGMSDIYPVTIPESFESSSYSYMNNWSTNNFYRTYTKYKTGFYSLSSNEFYGTASGTYSSASVYLSLPSNSIFSFSAAQINLTGNDVVQFYIDGLLTATLSLASGFNDYSYPVASGNHNFQWKITKYSASNYDGRIFIDDVKVTD